MGCKFYFILKYLLKLLQVQNGLLNNTKKKYFGKRIFVSSYIFFNEYLNLLSNKISFK